MVARDGFEPPYSKKMDLQSTAFNHFAISPNGGGSGIRTHDFKVMSLANYLCSIPQYMERYFSPLSSVRKKTYGHFLMSAIKTEL